MGQSRDLKRPASKIVTLVSFSNIRQDEVNKVNEVLGDASGRSAERDALRRRIQFKPSTALPVSTNSNLNPRSMHVNQSLQFTNRQSQTAVPIRVIQASGGDFVAADGQALRAAAAAGRGKVVGDLHCSPCPGRANLQTV